MDFKDMEEKVVCYYCGTIYDADREKCPLCGSSVRSEESAASRPVQRRRITEEERRQRRRAAKGKFAAPKKKKKERDPKGMRIAAFVFLLLAALVVFYFIGDMIGWWPGLENLVDRSGSYEPTAVNTACEELLVDPERIELSAVGETAQMTVSVNLDCEKTVYCISGDERVATVSQTAVTDIGEDAKSATFTITAVGTGETEITVTCGDKTAVCTVSCTDPEGTTESTQPEESTAPEDFEPELNYDYDASLYARGESLQLRVTNLPSGVAVTWRSDDETVAKVSQTGEVTAIGGGKTTVTATVGDKSVQIIIRCNFGDAEITGAHLERTDVTVRVGEKFDLYLYDSEGEHISDITYTVGNPDVCKVQDGIVTVTGSGTTTITVTFNGQEFTCIVRVH